ncbi:hypothetical protein [Stutzerimonas stutzeri]|uniref:Uncharacterized protein n=1 Tax=Stutzerimonas stutzeri TaxID=316 RepID=A0AA42PBZ9_STUST|nr:hypothetical protein [Stutzerimonas stutzeri]MDH1237260.1 hypothetical protein [Stutzerimonas stutzeri]
MKLEIIRGPAMSGKTTKLQEILRNAGDKGASIMAGVWSPGSLARSVERIASGSLVTTITIDDCSASQLKMLEKVCKASRWPGVTIYAVEAA